MLIKKYVFLIVSLSYSVSSLLSKSQIKNHFRNSNNQSNSLQRRTILNAEVNSDNFDSKMGLDVSANLTPSSDKIEKNQKKNKLIISSIISISYMSIIVSVMALPVSLSGMYIYIYMLVYIYSDIFINMYVYEYIYIYIYICIYVYSYICIDTHL
jgi:hypothetical protein